MQSRCILVITKSFKSLEEVFSNFVKGFPANVLLIIILAALLHFSPKMLKFYY